MSLLHPDAQTLAFTVGEPAQTRQGSGGLEPRNLALPASPDWALFGVIARRRLHTDESRLYFGADEHFASHETVKHSANEYVRGDIHTNSAKDYFSIFKRGISIVKRNTCTATSRNLTSAIITASRSVLTTRNVLKLP